MAAAHDLLNVCAALDHEDDEIVQAVRDREQQRTARPLREKSEFIPKSALLLRENAAEFAPDQRR